MARLRGVQTAHLVEGRVGGDHAERGVHERTAVSSAVDGGVVGGRDESVVGAVDLAEGVHGHERGHDEVARAARRRADPARAHVVAAAPPTDRRAGRGADRAQGHGAVGRGLARGAALVRARSHRRVAARQVEEPRAHDDGDDAGRGREAHPPLLAEPHHTVTGSQAERRPTRQHERVEPGDGAMRLEERPLARRRRPAAHLA